jgi:hypothetical protein
VHVSYVDDISNRKDVLTYTRAGGYTKGIVWWKRDLLKQP